jgi:hypothetical protein
MGIAARAGLSGAMALALYGCVAKTAFDVATAPVKVGAKAVDLATTSQSEADEKRGRELRERDERRARLQRKYAEQLAKCQHGDRYACSDARVTYGEIQDLSPSVPSVPPPN